MSEETNNTEENGTWKINDEARLNIKLSEYAYSVIIEDMMSYDVDNKKYSDENYKEPSKSTFVNRIFANFRGDALASIAIQANNYRENLNSQIKDTNSATDSVIDQLVQAHIEKLKKLSDSYETGISRKYKLNVSNRKYLKDTSQCKEHNHYSTMGKYLKAILEEYAHKPRRERELIYYKNISDTIETAIRKNKYIIIEQLNGTKYKVLPYLLASKPDTLYNYLVGFSQKLQTNNNVATDNDTFVKSNSNIFPFRISRIKEITILDNQFTITATDKKIINELLEKRDIPYIGWADKEHKIKLTSTGKGKYDSILTNRPRYDGTPESLGDGSDNTSYTMTFNCSESQLEYYFFKFGPEAEVISPNTTRELFKNKYIAALENYISPEKYRKLKELLDE